MSDDLPGPPPSAPHPPAGYPHPGYPQVIYIQPHTNGYAVASLVLGIVWIYGITSILALVFGYKAKREIDQSGGMQTGRGMAVAGIVLGWIGIAGLLLMIVLFVVAITVFNRLPIPSPTPTLL